MTRDYTNLERYLNELTGDIYPQPEDEGHSTLADIVVRKWMSSLIGCSSVLDVGCGEAFVQPVFEKFGCTYTGVTLGEDYLSATDAGRNVQKMDYSFLDFPDESFDLVFARHSLEHSPMPLLTLMEWHRVAKHWLGIVLPAPEHYGFGGRNHYSVMTKGQIEFLLQRSGWHIIWDDAHVTSGVPDEYWIMSEKVKR